MKIEDIATQEGRIYIQAWTKALFVFLGWPKSKTLKWAQKEITNLNDGDSLLFHETPSYWIARLLIPTPLVKGLNGAQLVYVRQVVCGVINNKDSLSDTTEEFDWNLAKVRVEKAMNEIQQKLKEPGINADEFLLEYRNRKVFSKKMPKVVAKMLRP